MNGMVNPWAYLLAKLLIEIPMMFVLSVCCMAVPLYGMLNFDPAGFGWVMLLQALSLWCCEAMAQLFGVQFKSPIVGMLQFMNLFFMCFLFSEFFLSAEYIAWPFKLFVHILPLKYAFRGVAYVEYTTSNLDYTGAFACDPAVPASWGNATTCHVRGHTANASGAQEGFMCPYDPSEPFKICYGRTGMQVLDTIAINYKSMSTTDTRMIDFGCMLAIGAFFKIWFMVTLYVKARRVTKIKPAAEGQGSTPKINTIDTVPIVPAPFKVVEQHLADSATRLN